MKYLAYGSNLNITQMKRRCPSAKIVGTAMLNGYRLMYKGSMTGSYLTIEKTKGHKVPLGIWEINDSDLVSLDRYEGYPIFYYRKLMTITITDDKGNDKNEKAIIYIMHEDRSLGCPSDGYVKTCIDGYTDFGFDTSFLKEAYRYSMEGRKYERQ